MKKLIKDTATIILILVWLIPNIAQAHEDNTPCPHCFLPPGPPPARLAMREDSQRPVDHYIPPPGEKAPFWDWLKDSWKFWKDYWDKREKQDDKPEKDRDPNQPQDPKSNPKDPYFMPPGDPIVINHPDYPAGHVTNHRGWYETFERHGHKSGFSNKEFFGPKGIDSLNYIDLGCTGDQYRGDRTIKGLTMFIDFLKKDAMSKYVVGMDNKITCGHELMWDTETNAYGMIERLALDTNNDGKLTKDDIIWPAMKIYNSYDKSVKHYSEYGYTEFNLSNVTTIKGDYVHNWSAYVDGAAGYVKDWRYKQALASGWKPRTYLPGVHLRAFAINYGGASGPSIKHDVINSMLGSWGKKPNDKKNTVRKSIISIPNKRRGSIMPNLRTPGTQ